MPYYKPLFDEFEQAKDTAGLKRAAGSLLKLRREMKKQGIPPRNLASTLLLATWNLREFGKGDESGKGAKFGPRLNESIQYIAEIVSHFDLIAIQEVNRNLRDLKRLMNLLGPWWDYIVTDVTEGRSGNEERIAFVYDSRKVRFDHVAGEVAFPDTPKRRAQQAARSPFLCSFKAGWRRFSLCSVHIFYGTANPNDPRRVREIRTLAELLATRGGRRAESPDGEPDSVFLLGDFNIFNQAGDRTTKALEENSFHIPPEIKKLPRGSNLAADKYYDQIAYFDPSKRLRATSKAGVFDFQTAVFGPEDESRYPNEMRVTDGKKFGAAKDKTKYYRNWRTFQISDHVPLWIELQSDFTEGYLATRAGFNKRRKRGRKEKST